MERKGNVKEKNINVTLIHSFIKVHIPEKELKFIIEVYEWRRTYCERDHLVSPHQHFWKILKSL